MDQVREFELKLGSVGFTLRALRWGSGRGPRVLGMHGWLDNAASLSPMAPFLHDMDLLVLDLPGHGHSDHLPPFYAYQMFDYVNLVSQAARELGWDEYHILAHSLGACVAVLLAGTFPEKILSLNLMEGLGPMTASDAQCASRYRRHLEERHEKKLISPVYPGITEAARARASSSNVNLECARILAERGTRPMGQGVIWSTDPGLRLPSPHPLTELQLGSFLESIICPVLLIRAEEGWPFDEDLMKNRVARIRNLQIKVHPGSHHNHMEFPEQVAHSVNQGPVFSV